jgi:hypothetical protein
MYYGITVAHQLKLPATRLKAQASNHKAQASPSNTKACALTSLKLEKREMNIAPASCWLGK